MPDLVLYHGKVNDFGNAPVLCKRNRHIKSMKDTNAMKKRMDALRLVLSNRADLLKSRIYKFRFKSQFREKLARNISAIAIKYPLRGANLEALRDEGHQLC